MKEKDCETTAVKARQVFDAVMNFKSSITSVFTHDFGLLSRETFEEFKERLEKAEELLRELEELLLHKCPFFKDKICRDIGKHCKECEVGIGCYWWSVMKFSVTIAKHIVQSAMYAARHT